MEHPRKNLIWPQKILTQFVNRYIAINVLDISTEYRKSSNELIGGFLFLNFAWGLFKGALKIFLVVSHISFEIFSTNKLFLRC